MNLYIDFGGTNFRYSFSDVKGSKKVNVLDSTKVDIKSFLDETIAKHSNLEFIGVSFSGLVKDGVILNAPNINIKSFDIKQYVEQNYDIPLEIENDLNCAALAEYTKKQSNMMALFYIGTGFGFSLIDNGKIITGANGVATELGHIPFKKTPFKCGCGRDDCVELSTSSSALKKWNKFYGLDKNLTLKDLKKLDTKQSKQIFKNFKKGLQHSFHTVLNICDPDMIIVGGDIGKDNEEIINILKKSYKKCSFFNERKMPNIVFSELTDGSLDGARILKKRI